MLNGKILNCTGSKKCSNTVDGNWVYGDQKLARQVRKIVKGKIFKSSRVEVSRM